MANVFPFHALRYANQFSTEMHNLIAPPYDVISREKCVQLHARHPANVIHLILGDPSCCTPKELSDPKRYSAARETLKAWKSNGTLTTEKKPVIFLLEDEFEWMGEKRTRKGLLLTVELEEFGSGDILPHEKTLAHPISDRFSLMKETHIQESPIYMTTSDTEGELLRILSSSPSTLLCEFTNQDEKIRHRVFTIDAPQSLKEIQSFFKTRKLLIADGHHRYQTAMHFKKEFGNTHPKSDRVLAFVAPSPAPGVVLSSIHRMFTWDRSTVDLIEILSKAFSAAESPVSFQSFTNSGAPLALLTDQATRQFLLTPKPSTTSTLTPVLREIPSALLNESIVQPIFQLNLDRPEDQRKVTYVKSADELRTKLKGTKSVGVWLRPLTVDQVMTVAEAGLVLPQKSTFFYPKVMSGIAFYDVSNP